MICKAEMYLASNWNENLLFCLKYFMWNERKKNNRWKCIIQALLWQLFVQFETFFFKGTKSVVVLRFKLQTIDYLNYEKQL